MSTPPTASRKAASWFNAAVLALALTACSVLAVLIATRVHRRVDVTVTRQHDLSPRTRQVLAKLDRNLTLIVAADLNSLDRATRQRTLDVLDQFSTASDKLKVSLIDTSNADGQRSYEQALASLAARDRSTIDASIAAATKAAAKAEALAGSIDALQQVLLNLKSQQVAGSGSLLSEQYLSTHAAVLRVAVQDLRTAATNARAALAAPDQFIGVPSIDKALALLKKPVADASKAVNDLADAFDSLAKDPQATESDKAAAGAVLPALRDARNSTGTLAADLAAVDIPRVLKIARALQLRRAALLVDEDAKPGAGIGVTAIDADTLLAVGTQGVDLRARTEDLVSGAVATLTNGVRPVVCIVHGAPTRLSAQDWPMLQNARQQLSMAGIDMVEWATSLDREMPPQVAVDSPTRPVVFVTITASSGKEGAQAVAAGIASFAKALDGLVSSGRNVLLSVNLSQVPATGSPDPLTQCVKPLGIEVDSGRPLLQSEKVQTRTVASPRVAVLSPSASHPISSAINDLGLLLQWPVTMSAPSPGVNVRVEPIVTVPADGTRWAESEWQEFYRAVGQLKGDYTRVSNPPVKDSPRDGSASGESWALAMAVESAAPQHPRQRLVVVGANGWFLDDVTGLRAEFDGRSAPVYPGNLQLLESSVRWLAGQDNQIQRGATVAGTPTIPALSNTQQAWLRWLLIAIMPALALAAGAVYRALRP